MMRWGTARRVWAAVENKGVVATLATRWGASHALWGSFYSLAGQVAGSAAGRAAAC